CFLSISIYTKAGRLVWHQSFHHLKECENFKSDAYLQLPRGISNWDNDTEAAVLRIGYVKPEIISWSPRIIVLHDFLSSE
ncbi:hypothetical protein D5086_025041, partial [Populus alba]